MDLLQLMQKSRAQLMPYWILSIGVCVVYALIVGLPSELNTFGELLSLLLAGPLQLGLCIYFLKITQGKEVPLIRPCMKLIPNCRQTGR